MAEAAEVKVKLVVASNSKKIAEEMQDDLKKVADAGDKAGKSISAKMGGGLLAGAVFMGNVYMELAKRALHFGKEAMTAPIEAFMESQKQVKALAGTFLTLDQSGKNTFDDLKELASSTKDELETFGIQVGIADDELMQMFTDVIERGGKSVDQAMELTKQMGLAGRAIPGGGRALAAGFEQMQIGIIRAKNPLVGLISATGTLKGSAKAVAAEMQKMPLDKQAELAEKAIAKMSAKMKNVPMTFSEATTSMKVLGENLLETMGEPMTKGLTKAVLHLRGMFITEGGQLTKLTESLMEGAEYFGNMLGKAFEMGSAFIDGFMDGVAIFGTEFKLIWREVFGESDATFKNMVEYAKLAGTVLGGFLKFFASGVGTLIVAAQKVVKYIVEAVGLIVELAGKLDSFFGVKGGAAQQQLGLAIQQKAFQAEQEDRLARMRKVGGGGREAREEYVATAGMTGQADYMKKINEAEAVRKETETAVADARSNATVEHAAQYWKDFQIATKNQDEAAQKNIAGFLGNSTTMANAIAKLGPDIIGEGKDSFIKALKAMGGKEAAEALEKATKPSLGIVGKGVTQHFSGAINIKQDFKDADPDRILVAFKNKLANAGSSRLQARTATPYGF